MKKIISVFSLVLISVWALAIDMNGLPQTEWQSASAPINTGSAYRPHVTAPGAVTPMMMSEGPVAPASGPRRIGAPTITEDNSGDGPGLPIGDGLFPLLAMLLLYAGVVALRRRKSLTAAQRSHTLTAAQRGHTLALSTLVCVLGKGCLLAGGIGAILTSCSPRVQPAATTPDQYMAVLDRAVDQHRILFGQHDATLYGHTWRDVRAKSDCRDVCGDYPAIMSFDLGYLEIANPHSIDSVPFDRIRQAVIDQYQRGGLVSISWHARNPLTGGDSWDVSCDSVVRSILPGASHHQVLDKWLGRVSDFLLTLRDPATGQLIPLIFRPWHEHTGFWFWWGNTSCTPDEYIALFRYTHDYLTRAGLNNLIWAYSPNLGVTRETYLERYPGNDYIDLLGIDCYDFKPEAPDEYIRNATACLDLLTEMGKTLNKPIAFTETGLQTLENHEWFMHSLYPVIRRYPISYLLVWRNADDNPIHFYVPYPGHPSEKDFRRFHRQKDIVFLRDIHKL